MSFDGGDGGSSVHSKIKNTDDHNSRTRYHEQSSIRGADKTRDLYVRRRNKSWKYVSFPGQGES